MANLADESDFASGYDDALPIHRDDFPITASFIDAYAEYSRLIPPSSTSPGGLTTLPKSR